MSFRDFITSRLFRRTMETEFARYQNIKPPANPSPRYINKLVQRLLNPDRARAAQKELGMMGAATVPALAAALGDARFHQAVWPDDSQVDAPLDAVLELLVPHGGAHILAIAKSLAESPSEDVRKTIALHLASLGRVEAISLLGQLLEDRDGYVRAYVAMGIGRAASEGRADDLFRQQAYDLLLARCDQDWGSATNDAVETIIALDPRRAATDLASPRWLSRDGRHTHRLIAACNSAGIQLPEVLTRPLLDYALPLAVGPDCYPNQYLAAAALEALALRLGDKARPLLVRALDHEQNEICETAARGIARLAGVTDPVHFVYERVRSVGVDKLAHAQGVVFLAATFNGEVCNGGIMQFFGNPSGDYAAETLDALRELAHPEAVDALASALQTIGPLAREPERDMRLAAVEGRYDELQAAFRPLESAYYRTSSRLRQKILLYAAMHAEDFRIPPAPPLHPPP